MIEAVLAPAKINLYLHVVGRRPDGYHLLDSLVAFAAVGDRLAVTPAADLRLTIDGPFAAGLAADADNLVLRAARALTAEAGRSLGADIRLTKNLPVASGIGGGSADAAATLLALNRLWGLQLSSRRLAEIGLALGADVPVCLVGTPSFFGGIGDEIQAAPPLPSAHLLLVNPGMPLATADVFRARARAGRQYSAPARWAESIADAAALAHMLSERSNDLADSAIALMPVISDVLGQIESASACLLARLSGSGATCFGLFANAAEARSAAERIAAARADWWVAATRLLPG